MASLFGRQSIPKLIFFRTGFLSGVHGDLLETYVSFLVEIKE